MLRFTLVFICLFSCSYFVAGQDTVYHQFEVDSFDQKLVIKNIIQFTDSLNLFFITEHNEAGKKTKTYYSPERDTSIYEGRYTRFDSLGNVDWYQTFKNNKLDGELRSFWPNGITKRIDHYTDGKLIEGTCFNGLGNEIDYYDFEIMPQFPGGDKELITKIYKHLKYPKKARKNGTEGYVLIRFNIDELGTMKDPQVFKAPSKELALASLEVVRKIIGYRWQPGQQDGKNVSVMYTLPIRFKLDD